MHDADKGYCGASSKTARRPDHDAGRVATYRHSRRASASVTTSNTYRAGRAEELEQSARRNAYRWFSLALVALACACLIAAAVLGEAWLLVIAVGLALLAAALSSCA